MNVISGSTSDFLHNNVKVLRSRVSKTAWQGIVIAVVALIIATLAVSQFEHGNIYLSSLIEVQKTNFALWILNVVPFVFAFWGQYSSTVLAYEASAMVMDQTQELRDKADSFEKQARHSITHDLLTDMPNKELFYDRVQQQIVSPRGRSAFSILLIEVANYKEISDTLGRNSSDSLIKKIAVRLESAFPTPLTIARLESNIFSMLINQPLAEKEILSLADSVHRVLHDAFLIEKVKLSTQANIGIVHYPNHGTDVDTLVQRASIALYMAQNSNKGSAVYDSSFDAHSPKQLTLMSELHHAIENQELELFYQPKVRTQDGVLSGAEALVRWNHPKHGVLAPDLFIPLMERSRLIQGLTCWVIQEGFTQCAQWHQQGLDIVLSINLSAKDLNNPELPDLISGIKGATGVNPQWITLEITESSLMTDPEAALAVINRIHAMGFQFSIDDYGTGYSSLSYLKQLPLKELKIDRSFVTDILQSESDAVIVNATINLAHNLGLEVTAEGVEDAATLALLTTEGCDLVQGFHLGRPMPESMFTQWAFGRS
ncbi:bifunctional diguanylate cyclase/phosphodiesterase [Amphritea sp. 1_MG-2023]|uniref:putative bifunctional diguanylate cyclase/phosphodiesterase n=1 Tax=Amphritea sp. 1_MG-2023 TaxID=3062670 RepID=UPI0026E282B4|nr:bifunctional diguanylate cyclase/phosphodiesterase [Amphritea sp. 1_MG-2023]MDO6564499.1 bifunctional diguanylate cyclase/phosphodiesterase [Amphritea sp. 1_MG-2023]